MKKLTKRQTQAMEFIRQFEALDRRNCDEVEWLKRKFGIGGIAAIRLLRSLDEARRMESLAKAGEP